MNRVVNLFGRCVLSIATFAAMSATAQQQQLDTLKKRFSDFRENIILEKVFLHIDRTSYVTGETMWFKMYCVDGSLHRPLSLSKVGYIEVLDKNGKAVLQTKIALDHGTGSGSLFIPATLSSDNHVVRAYTSWMKNFPQEYFFHQPISIINPFRKSESVAGISSGEEIDAQFLPEGGNLVADQSSRIAFRVTGKDGRGLNFKGAVINSTNDTIQHFSPERFGIGTFELKPEPNQTYRIAIRANGRSHVSLLPKVQAEGYAMRVNKVNDAFDVNVSTKMVTSKPVTYLFVHSRNQVVFAEMKFVMNGNSSFSVPMNRLSDGISHLTVFDSELHPVCERLVYKKPIDLLQLHASADAQDYSHRRKVKLSITADQNQNANLSISIFRRDSLAIFDHQRISDYLMLTSDLHGQIESPAFYLNEGTDQDFDNLMLTHGWRKFSWDQVLDRNHDVSFLPEVQGPILTGNLFDETGKPAPGIKTYVSTPSKIVRLYTCISGSHGELMYNLKDVKGDSKLVLQTNFSKDSLYEFRMNNPFSKDHMTWHLPVFSLNINQQQTIRSRSVAMQVQDVFHWEENFKIAEPPADSTPFYGKPDESYRLDEFTRFPVMEEVMREYVPGVWVRKRQGEFYFMVLDNINKSIFKEDPLILVDGVPVFNADRIMHFSPLKIKKLEVVDRLFFEGRLTFPGIVSYSTYTGDLSGFKIHPKSVLLEYQGLQLKRNFYSPVYETERQRSNRMPDQRTLLQWWPDVKVTSGKAELEFFTSDLSGTFEINVQGMNSTGRMGSTSTTFTVSRYDNP